MPWTVDGRYWEEELRNIPQHQVGVSLRGRSVRSLTDEDFSAIVAAGLAETLAPKNSDRLNLPADEVLRANASLNTPTAIERERRVEQILSNRLIRDASFRGLICDAYKNRCAVTRLLITDQKNNPEVQAAHIWAVADGGPDVVSNGIALSATVHWLFDRHLITIDDNFRLIVARSKVPEEFGAVYAKHGEQLHLPTIESDRPHPAYLAKHRAKFYEKNTR